MKTKFDCIIFSNRWTMFKYQRPCDWTIIGIYKEWFSRESFCYNFGFLGFSINIWFKKV